MTDFFIQVYRYFRQHRTVCWCSMLVLLAFFGWQASQIQLEEDINKLMPSSRNEDGTIKLAFADLKIKDKVFLLFSLSPTPSQRGGEHGCKRLAEVCDAFADSLQQDTALVDDVFYRLDEDLLPDAIDYLSDHLPAYIDTAAYSRFDSLLTHEHVRKQMEQIRKILLLAQKSLSKENIDRSFVDQFIKRITVHIDNPEAHENPVKMRLEIELNTGKSLEKSLIKTLIHRGQRSKKMIESYEKGLK